MSVEGTRDAIRILRRGAVRELRGLHPRTTLLDWLRLSERSCGTKEGCGEGDCGACTVLVGRLREGRLVYEPVNACIALVGQLDGCEVVTVEDLAGPGGLHPVQQAMVDHHGSQCGFCTPGIVMSLTGLYLEGSRPVTRDAACDALAGNLCRCTGYRPILDAALDACAVAPADHLTERREATEAILRDLADGADVFAGTEERFFASPASEDTLAELAEAFPLATVVAGATDVGLWITKALAPIERIIAVGRVAGFDRVEDLGDAIAFGAGVTHAQAMPVLAAFDPDLGELMRRFGSAQIRASGTVGGNVANGSPIGDLPPALIALGATVELRKGARIRTLPLEDFFLAYRKQDREPGEFVRRLVVPKPGPADRIRVFKISKRLDEDISSVMMACRLTVEGTSVREARVAFGGMAGTPKRAPSVEAAMRAASLTDGTTWRRAGDAVTQDFTPLDDHRASAAYRMSVARNLVVKAMAEIAGAPSSATRVAGVREAAE
ncbi:xanthine dehydrogenase small subunit [Alsobacter sp. R-9]